MMRWMTRQLGITLLEVLLVLAIASMIIVMSIRYYQSAVGSQGANSVLEEVQAITAGMDSLAAGSGGYINVTNPSSAVSMAAGLPNGSNLQISDVSAAGYSVTLTITSSGSTCTNLNNQVASNPNLSTIYTNFNCAGSTVTYTYVQPT